MSRKCLSLDHLSVLSCHSTPTLTFISLLFSLNGSFLAYFFQVTVSVSSYSECISLSPKLDSNLLLFCSSFSFFIASSFHLRHVTICSFKVLCGSSFVCSRTLQFHQSFVIVLVFGVSLLLLSELNTPLCPGSFSCSDGR